MSDSLGNHGEGKRKRKRRLIVSLSLIAIILLVLIGVVAIRLYEKRDELLYQENSTQNGNHGDGQYINMEAIVSFFDMFKEGESDEDVWVIEGEPVSNDLLYGFYLPVHCSNTDIANVDVVMNMFEEKTWSTYLSSNGQELTLSAVPLLWDGSQITVDMIYQVLSEIMENKDDSYVHAKKTAYQELLIELDATHALAEVTYYDVRGTMYKIDCVYTVEENELTLSMIYFDEEDLEYSIIPMETYEVVREKNEITMYKEKNFVKYVPYNLCENASIFRVEAFAENEKSMYEGIAGFAYYNVDPKAENWPLYGCVYFADGSKAPKAVFDFSEENQMKVSWMNKEVDYYGTTIEIEEFGEVTVSYEMVGDTGLILEVDGVSYYYLEQYEE